MAVSLLDVTAHLRGSALAGAVGAAGFGAVFAVMGVVGTLLGGADQAGLLYLLVMALLVLVMAAVVYFTGVLVFGAPLRWLLRRVRLSGRTPSAVVGAVLSAAVASLFFLRPPVTWEDAVMIAGVALGGGLAALVYRRHGEPHVVD